MQPTTAQCAAFEYGAKNCTWSYTYEPNNKVRPNGIEAPCCITMQVSELHKCRIVLHRLDNIRVSSLQDVVGPIIQDRLTLPGASPPISIKAGAGEGGGGGGAGG
jgi:hypothetical protein